MKFRFILCLCFGILTVHGFGQSPQELKNIQAFNQLFGYVKYFHPSDEAFENDWDYFAIYGVQEVLKCANDKALIETLNRLFKPLAPSLFISNRAKPFNTKTAFPVDTAGYNITYWQHEGVNYGNFLNANDPEKIYNSVRVGNPYKLPASTSNAGFAITEQLKEEWLGKSFRLIGEFKYEHQKRSRLGYNGNPSFFANIGYERIHTPIVNSNNGKVILSGVFPTEIDSYKVGATTTNGKLTVNDISLEVNMDGVWTPQELPFKHFMISEILEEDWLNIWGKRNFDFSQEFQTKRIPIIIEKKEKFVEYTGEPIFDASARIGEGFEIELAEKVFASAPYAVYFNALGTYPTESEYPGIKDNIANTDYDADSFASKAGNLITTWNLFRFFHPNIDMIEADWNEVFRKAVKMLYKGKSFSVTLEEVGYHLQDAHIAVMGDDYYFPPFSWERLADNQVVITGVAEDMDDLSVGDIIVNVDGISVHSHFDKYLHSHSSFSKASRAYFLNFNSLRGEKGALIALRTKEGKTVAIRRTEEYPFETPKEIVPVEVMDTNTIYFNVGLIETEQEYYKAIGLMMGADYAIIDFRNDINREVDDGLFTTFFRKAYSKPEESRWMRVHQRIYPDSAVSGIHTYGLTEYTENPHDKPFTCKMICLIDGGVASYPETVLMALEEHQDDLVIIGQQTAGGNGNTNPFILPGGYTIYYSGMEVRKFDGSSFYLVGILPDIKVDKTYEDVILGTDPTLDEALRQIKNWSK